MANGYSAMVATSGNSMASLHLCLLCLTCSLTLLEGLIMTIIEVTTMVGEVIMVQELAEGLTTELTVISIDLEPTLPGVITDRTLKTE